MSGLLLRGDFARLWWGGLISMIGNWMLGAALPAYVFLTTRSIPAASLMFLASVLPGILFGSLGGVVADRFDRKRLMVALNLAAALSLLPLLLLQPGMLWPVYLAAALRAIVSLPLGPAEDALLPSLVGRDNLVQANALNALNNNIARLVGPSVGGILVATWGLNAVVIADVATFVVAALFIAGIGAQGAARTTARRLVSQELREGLSTVLASPALRVLVLSVALMTIGEGVFGVLLAPFVTGVLGGDATAYGWVLSAQAVGGIAGGTLVARHARRLQPSTLLWAGAIGLGLVDLAIFLYPLFWQSVIPAIALMVLAGVPASAGGAGWSTLVQRHAPDEVRGRVFGVTGQIASITVLMGAGLANVAGDTRLIIPVICIHGATLLIGGLWRLAAVSRGLFREEGLAQANAASPAAAL
jgi:predicted MFS family arabinose efflux permease